MEVLVVIAISVILFGLLFYPMFRSFDLTRQTRVKIEAQDAARLNLERISREISDAMFVYDNSQPMLVMAPGDNPLTNPPRVPLPYAKLDIVLPRMLMHCENPTHPAGQPRDYERDSIAPDWPGEEDWPPCPICNSENVTARPIQPMSPSLRVVRYFVGLMSPNLPYSNTFEDKNATGAINTYILYRAEFSPYDPKLVKFDSLGRPDLNDPTFFYDHSNTPGGGTYSSNWKKISRVIGPVKNVNLIVFDTNSSGAYTGSAMSSIRFTPTAIENDALSPTYLNDTEAEAPEAIPAVFRAQYGLWAPDHKVFIYRGDFSSVYFTGPYNGALWLMLHGSPATPVFCISDYVNMGTLNFGSASDEQKLALYVDEKVGEVRCLFNGPTETPPTTDINNAGGYYRINLTPFGVHARVVPGSEEIMGPDQTPASGRSAVRYSRVPLALGTPGLNQYKIDYDTGEIWFASGPGYALPQGNLTIDYKFQNNMQGDIVRSDYTTKNLLTITFGIRIFDDMTQKLSVAELTNKVRVRNTPR